MRIATILLVSHCVLTLSGCSLLLPQVANQPVIRNPFPQLSHVAIAPFFNQSDEPTVDGRNFAMAYYAELQRTPGFKVVPLGVVEEAILDHRIDLNGPGEARRLAQLLGVDAVVVGAVTDYTPYYPPRCGLRVEWYTANRGFHEIPAGYGLPWNTPEEEFIPDSLVYESQLALARSQMAAQAPNCDDCPQNLPAPPASETESSSSQSAPSPLIPSHTIGTSVPSSLIVSAEFNQEGVPPLVDENNLPCLSPDPTVAVAPSCQPYHGPVLSHTQIYLGNDPHITQALKGYVYFRDDARISGWKSYLQRSDDFVRFCCNMHISEMLSARGGSRKTRVVLRWPDSR